MIWLPFFLQVPGSQEGFRAYAGPARYPSQRLDVCMNFKYKFSES